MSILKIILFISITLWAIFAIYTWLVDYRPRKQRAEILTRINTLTNNGQRRLYKIALTIIYSYAIFPLHVLLAWVVIVLLLKAI
jgi:hypothetical protein